MQDTGRGRTVKIQKETQESKTGKRIGKGGKEGFNLESFRKGPTEPQCIWRYVIITKRTWSTTRTFNGRGFNLAQND